MDSGNSSNKTQHISRPFKPEKGQYNTRCLFNCFKKTSKIKKTTRKSSSKGYKIWLLKLELQRWLRGKGTTYKTGSKVMLGKKPTMFRMFGFFHPRKIKIIVLINHKV